LPRATESKRGEPEFMNRSSDPNGFRYRYDSLVKS
jgi:hypothetical protein